MNPQILYAPVEAYLASLAVAHGLPHPVFERLHTRAFERAFPIVGPEVGRLLMQLAMLRRPARVLELGSGFGYSAIWWALGAPDAEIHLTDFNQANLDEAMAFATEAGVAGQLHLHRGDGLQLARSLPGPWDIIFCDIEKADYPDAVGLARDALRAGGLLVMDNMLWMGRVALPPDEQDREAEAVATATRLVYTDSGWAASLLPLRDGVLLAVRKD